ncbi:alginate lyase family protein, partial [bacterium]|nr:alginate lyase family protein [bacterium]
MKNAANENNTPMEGVCLLDPSRMAGTRERLRSGDEGLARSLRNLCERADEAMQTAPYSVMDKRAIPPSGDKHDYMSLGTYWWPNPDTPDGLPYIRRDGERNPEGYELDHSRIVKLCRDCSILAYAFYFTGNSAYSKQAVSLLRAWFLDPDTRMNPHLNYAQSIPGICEGRDIGIIDTSTRFPGLLDAIGILRSSGEMPSSTFDGLMAWMNEYLNWLLDSPNGRGEASQKNNHGTWHDA